MKDGGVVDMSLLDGAAPNPGDIGAREATVQEFVDMAGASRSGEGSYDQCGGDGAFAGTFEFRSTLHYMLSTRVEADYRLVQPHVDSPLLTARNRQVVKAALFLQSHGSRT
jgi:hypothetical protein